MHFTMLSVLSLELEDILANGSVVAATGETGTKHLSEQDPHAEHEYTRHASEDLNLKNFIEKRGLCKGADRIQRHE